MEKAIVLPIYRWGNGDKSDRANFFFSPSGTEIEEGNEGNGKSVGFELGYTFI